MPFRALLVVTAILIALSAAWGKRQTLKQLVEPPAAPARPIVFDNGTVRQHDPEPPAAAAVSQIPLGTMRKCVRGRETSYTDRACPTGHQEKPVGGSPVNVLSGQAVARQDDPRAQGTSRATLYKALDLTRDEKLRERMLERAVDGQR